MKIIHIAYASDERFSKLMGVSIYSVLKNNKQNYQIQFHIMENQISDLNKGRVDKLIASYKQPKPDWVNMNGLEERIGGTVKLDRGSISQFSRIFIGSVLSEAVERVLYLDCDTLVLDDISELYFQDLSNNSIGALADAFSKFYRRNIGLPEDAVMFNSGVMLIDLRRWRGLDVESRAIHFILDAHGYVQQGDQGVLNAVLVDDTMVLQPKYNAISTFFDFTYSEIFTYRHPESYYSKAEIQNAIDHPLILHFTSSFASVRPWFDGGLSQRYSELWREYNNSSPWKDIPYTYMKKSMGNYIGGRIFHLIPRSLAIFVAGVLQSKIRPWINSVNKVIEQTKVNDKI